jgi:putative glycosyltransferase (TIGR04372 family)
MGAFVDEPLPETGDPKIIDYATHYRNDFMDVYLMAKCRFFLASNSGLCMVSLIFDVPVAVANHAGYTFPFYRSSNLFIPRLIRCKNTGRIVTYPEAEEAGFYSRSHGESRVIDYHTFAHEWQQHDSDDILNLCLDMMEKLNGNIPLPEVKRLQALYAEKYISHHPDYLHAAKVGARFANKYRHLLFPRENEGDRQ